MAVRPSIWQTLIKRKLVAWHWLRMINLLPCRRPWWICSIRWISLLNILESLTRASSNAFSRASSWGSETPKVKSLGTWSSNAQSGTRGSFQSTWWRSVLGSHKQVKSDWVDVRADPKSHQLEAANTLRAW